MAVKRVLITGAAGQIGYSIIPMVASGQATGPNDRIELVLLDIPQAIDALNGVVLEIEDGAFPLLDSVTVTSDLEVAFKGTNVAFMIGGFPRLPGMDRKDLLEKNAQIFVAAGKALEQHGARDCKILVVANPANTNCFIMQQQCPSIPAENFTCLTRLDHNRAISQVAIKAGTTPNKVKKVTIWGNHSNTMVPDVTHAIVDGKSAHDVLPSEWIKNDFTPTVQTRGAAVLKARQKSSAMSAANAAVNHIASWLLGTESDDWTSIGIVSTGQYGITPGLVFSYPCICKDGQWKVVEGLELSEEIKAGLKKTEEELVTERDIFRTF